MHDILNWVFLLHLHKVDGRKEALILGSPIKKPRSKARVDGSMLKESVVSFSELSGGKKPSLKQKELRLIQSKRDIETPPPLASIFTPG